MEWGRSVVAHPVMTALACAHRSGLHTSLWRRHRSLPRSPQLAALGRTTRWRKGKNLRCIYIVLSRDGWHTRSHRVLCRRVLWGTFRRRLLAREELYCRNRCVADRRIIYQLLWALLQLMFWAEGLLRVQKVVVVNGAVKWRGVDYGAGGEAYEVPSGRFPRNLV